MDRGIGPYLRALVEGGRCPVVSRGGCCWVVSAKSRLPPGARHSPELFVQGDPHSPHRPATRVQPSTR
ncbi:hypothetical protein ACFW2K_38570, partial [Streptomyces nigra]